MSEREGSPVADRDGGILYCVATKKGLTVLQAALRVGRARPNYVTTFVEKGVAQSYDKQIVELAQQHRCDVIPLKQFRTGLLEFVKNRHISALVCIGWRYLVPSEVMDAVDGEVIVAHDSLLPRLRGFAPLPTAIIAGETETGVTYLRASQGVDDGRVLWQRGVPISPDDTIESLTEKILPLYAEGIQCYLEGAWAEGTAQDESAATYSIWRDELDYRIDWSLDASVIERSVRALGPPYLGAQCVLRDDLVTIQKATVLDDLSFAIRQPGKVWALDEQGRPLIVCGRGLLRIDAATIDGTSIVPMKSLRNRFL